MAGSARGDDFDECEEPGGTRWCEWMRDDDNSGSLIVPQSELEGDDFEDEWLAPKQTLSDMQDEELDDDLLHSDDDGPSPGVTAGQDSTFDPTSQTSTKAGRPGGDEGPGVVRVDDRAGTPADGGVSAEDVVDIGIGGSLDNEFQVDDGFSGVIRSPPVAVEVQETVEDEADRGETSEAVSEEEENETWIEELKRESELSEEEDEEEDQESHRLRFKTERKDASAVPLSSVADKRRNIPETLELSEEAAATLFLQATTRTRGWLGRRGRGGRAGCSTPRLQDVGHRGQVGALSLRPPYPPGSFSLAASQARGSWRSLSPIQDTSLSHSQAVTPHPTTKLQSADSPLSGWAKIHRTSSQWHHLAPSKQLFPPSGLTCPPQSARLGKQGFINLLPRRPIRNRTTQLVPQPCPLMPPLSHSTPLQQARAPIRQAYGSECQTGLLAPPPPAAQVRPFARQPRSTQETPVCTAKAECKPGVHPGRGAPADLSQKSGPEGSAEDEEARRYGQKLEEQRRLREKLLQHKELRRRQQAEMRKKELLQLAGAPPAGCEPQVRPLMVHSLPAAAPSRVQHLAPPTSAPFRLNAAQQVSSGMPVSSERQLGVTTFLPSRWRSASGPGARWPQRYSPPLDQRTGLKRIVTQQDVSHPLKVRVVQLLEVQAAGGDGDSRPRKQTSQERNVTLRRCIQQEPTTPGGGDGEGAPPTNWIIHPQNTSISRHLDQSDGDSAWRGQRTPNGSGLWGVERMRRSYH
nr:RNA-binding protein 33 isoform X3 [Paramormyrops kingsleyae]